MSSAKDVICMDVMPAEATTDMHRLEECIREMKIPGVQWAETFTTEEVGFGIKKLRIACIVDAAHGQGEVDVQSLQEAITALHDHGHAHTAGHGHHNREKHGKHGHEEEHHGVAAAGKLVQSVELVAITE